jgi:hypothetical protein
VGLAGERVPLAIPEGASLDRFRRFSQFYKNTALFLLNAVVLLVVVNVALFLLFLIRDQYVERKALRDIARLHESPALKSVYPDMDAESIGQLLTETWSRPYAYEAMTQFKERPFVGRFVNVSEAGYRLSKNQGPWPPDRRRYNVFLFGGSTAFGYGVPDDQTIASYLQDHLRAATSREVYVYNFGRSSYISSQERVLLDELLLSGFVPDMALFVDGLNEFAFPNGPAETQRLTAVFDSEKHGVDRWNWIGGLPMTRLARFVHRSVVSALSRGPQVDPRNVEPTAALDDDKYHDPDLIASVIERYLENKKQIEAVVQAYGTSAVFVWQPIPLYKYNLEYHLFATGDFGSNFFARYGYGYFERRVKQQPPGDNFLWCADMQESLAEPLYVDKVHYTAKMGRLFASTIGDQLVERGLLDGRESGPHVVSKPRS